MQKSIENFLEAADGAGNVLAHAKLLIKLGHQYQTLVPAYLAQASRLVNYASGTIVIHADNNAVAAKLRQLANTLTDGFSRKGLQCNGVLVKVQAPEKHGQLRIVEPKVLSNEAAAELERFQENLSESPLKEALRKLLDHSARE